MGQGRLAEVVRRLDLKGAALSEKGGLVVMTLRGFIQRYTEELEDYYDEDFGVPGVQESKYGSSIIFCLIDNRPLATPSMAGGTGAQSDVVPRDIRKNIRKAGRARRKKLRHQWSYENPLNRIQGYIVVKDLTNKNHPQKVLSLSCICSTSYTRKKGIGGELMKLLRDFGKDAGYEDIILEVANEFSGEKHEEEEEEDEEEEDEEEEDDEEEEHEEIWFPDEDCLEVLSYEMWRKCMRKNEDGTPYYNLEKDYIEVCIYEYLMGGITSEDPDKLCLREGNELPYQSKDGDEPLETEYGGFWYLKGKRSQCGLMKFYEKWGFKEDKRVHLSWGCYGAIPFPTMRLSL
jgi:hypothetical protein